MKQDLLFISHSSFDTKFVKKLAMDLQARGVSRWLDVLDIETGEDWNDSIQDALRNCTYLLVVWSKKSVRSPEVLAEVFQAKSQDKEILQIIIDECKRPAQFTRLQAVDFRGNYEEAFEKLVSFTPLAKRKIRLKEFEALSPANPYPRLPQLRQL